MMNFQSFFLKSCDFQCYFSENIWCAKSLNHLSLIYPWSESEKKNQNGGRFLMTSWQNNAVTSWQVTIWNKFLANWSYIIFRKSHKISSQTSKGFSKYATKYTVWVGLKRLQFVKYIAKLCAWTLLQLTLNRYNSNKSPVVEIQQHFITSFSTNPNMEWNHVTFVEHTGEII